MTTLPSPPRTAQEAFKKMMLEQVEPALRSFGLKGNARVMWCREGDYFSSLRFQKSVHSTKREVYFTVHLNASYSPANSVYWRRNLLGLIPGNREPWWTVSVARPIDSVAAKFLKEFSRYGWPAILAALDDPGFPVDPAKQWSRSFPSTGQVAGPNTNLGLKQLSKLLGSAGLPDDDLFAKFGDEDHLARLSAVRLAGEIALGDPRRVTALIDRLEHDPVPEIRRAAACGLRSLARQNGVGQALLASASQDEDLEVRWEARYAIRLAGKSGVQS